MGPGASATAFWARDVNPVSHSVLAYSYDSLMDLLGAYGDGDNDSPQSSPPPVFRPAALMAAPEVDTTGLVLYDNKALALGDFRKFQDPAARVAKYNLPIEDMHAPVLGPEHPFQRDGLAEGLKNHRAGHVEDMYLHHHTFEEEYNKFHRAGAEAPDGGGLVGAPRIDEERAAKRMRRTAEKRADAARKAAERETLAGSTDPLEPFTLAQRQPWALKEAPVVELTDEQKEFMAQIEKDKAEKAGVPPEQKAATSFFHLADSKDYQGRSWIEPPRDRVKENDYCYLPKRWVHTWSGHTKGVNAIRFFPGTGHLLLSAGLDGKVKIWDVFNNQKCVRTYMGHSKGVRDINFTNDGRRFVSCGYDRNIQLWDTETGKVIRTFATGKIYYVAKFHPSDDKQHVLMAGCNDKKIYQWDVNSGDLVQEYNYHLGAVNTITFVDEGRRFVSSSDDKTLRVWEFGIPVQIKYIADPSMHSIPAISLHPAGTYFIGQSLDNQVVTYSTKERFRQNRKKTFRGHNTAGYACQVNFSPDARFVMSGDAEGRLFFWDWQHPHRVTRTIKAHDAVCIGCEWHPLESSKVATCGWDGLIKYWD